jgi:hypothetical protein
MAENEQGAPTPNIENLKDKSFVGCIFEEPGSARFHEALYNVNPAQILAAGEFLSAYARHLMQKSWINREMAQQQKEMQSKIQVARSKLQ